MRHYRYSFLVAVLCIFGPFLILRPWPIWWVLCAPLWLVPALFAPVFHYRDDKLAALITSGILTYLTLAAFTYFGARSKQALIAFAVVVLCLTVPCAYILWRVTGLH